ncbi:mucin-2-like [Argiope bruennichi]|uniref:mucin-2-like n=1 Tax=Argiope bruennichi TaxID=94029 RepID=UPI00249530C6|nr:mucin-2-like [Argiope bruennichi]
MIDKRSFYISICSISLLLSLVIAAPTTTLPDSTNASPPSANSSERKPPNNPLSTSLTTSSPLSMTSDESKPPELTTTPKPSLGPSNRFQATPATTMKSRKNKNDLFFCCSDDSSSTDTIRRSKERERNTKPPVLKKGKNHELEEPYFERRPALLLRFFPDGTAVLISKFQLHLHVKPKQIKFEPVDEDTNLEEPLEYDGKSFEVTYKRLEAIPSAREQNLEELPEEELSTGSFVAYNDDIDHRDHELVTSTMSSTKITEARNKPGRPSPLIETTESPQTTSPNTELSTKEITTTEEMKTSKVDETTLAMGDSPFFIMTAGEMSSLQQQYDPVQAAPLRATTTQSTTQKEVTSTTTEQTTVTQTIPTSTFQTTMVTNTEPSVPQTEPTTTTTKCLSFRNQLSLVLSTEDNIDNSLLKKHVLPTQDCNSSDGEPTNTFARLQSVETTATESTFTTESTTPSIIPTTQTPTTTPYTGNNLVPYLSSRLSNNPSKSDVVVVTSLPVLIDLKNSRNKPVTEVPAWKEVTVGVVRDQQGQPLKPRYNNWTAHLRGLKKKPGNKFWNELTTPRPDFKSHQRLPSQQNFQQLPSQVNHAFWSDLQRQRPPMVQHSRDKNVLNPPPYITNPPQSYPASNAQTYQVWRNPGYEANSRWNDNINPDYISPHDIRRTKSLRNSPQNFEHQEARQPQQWNNAQRQMSRRW